MKKEKEVLSINAIEISAICKSESESVVVVVVVSSVQFGGLFVIDGKNVDQYDVVLERLLDGDTRVITLIPQTLGRYDDALVLLFAQSTVDQYLVPLVRDFFDSTLDPRGHGLNERLHRRLRGQLTRVKSARQEQRVEFLVDDVLCLDTIELDQWIGAICRLVAFANL